MQYEFESYKPKWILESDVFDEGLDDLVSKIKMQGMEVRVVKYIPFSKEKDYQICGQ